MKTKIDIQHLSVEYGRGAERFTALADVSLTVREGEFVCLLGPSGCGKTTLLNAIAGFERPTSGSLLIDGSPVDGPNPRHTVVFQDYGLLPWRTVERNVGLGLENRNLSPSGRQQTVDRCLDLVGLTAFRNYYPEQLSGGMRQRIALARALAVDPDMLLMDEPFGALDVITRARMQDELIRIWQTCAKTIVFVTHDIDEAVYLADRVVIMAPDPGRIKAVKTIDLGRGRDRTSVRFMAERDQILEIFEMKNYTEVEFYL
ncbi:MAG: ABC transporter ATP-binding protein [Rikenellaceae bacterium]|jgi:NitT/TauT family transport system ATP-binding protein|nr:ABC transporter ATP-binding protein [Rikenellaceae bacterium]